MNYVQAATLVTRVRQDLNVEGSTGQPTDQEIVDRLNRAKGEYVDLIRGSGLGYFRKRTPQLATSQGVSLYQLPADFVSLRWVLAYLTPTQFIRCTPFTDDMRPMFATIVGTGWVFGQPVYYQLDDDGWIEFMPVPTGQFNYQIGYEYQPPDFTYSSGVGAQGQWTELTGFSDFVVARAGAGIARKLKLWDTAAAMSAEAERVADRIRQMAPLRDMGSAEVQRDITRTAPAGYWEEYDS